MEVGGMRDYAELAIKATSFGLSVLPVQSSNKKPVEEWKDLQDRILDDVEIHSRFRGGLVLAFIGGEISGNLEAMDFDVIRFWGAFKKECIVKGVTDLLNRLIIQETPSGGIHLVYRCPDGVSDSTKLAWAPFKSDNEPDKDREIAIETRGEGGYFLASPSPGYKLLQGKWSDIPVITEEDRNILFDIALSLNEVERTPPPAMRAAKPSDGKRPSDTFNREHSWEEVLLPHGWTKGGQIGTRQGWTRPGKLTDAGNSACTGNIGTRDGDDLMHVFSTSCYPLSDERCYSKFDAMCVLKFKGDFKKAIEYVKELHPRPEFLPCTPDDPKEFPLTDAGNAERMAHLFGENIRYCAPWGKWLIWNEWKWEISTDGSALVYQYAIETVRTIQREAQNTQDTDRRKALGTWGFKCEEKKKLDAMVALCAKLPGIPISTDQIDSHPGLLNLRNGVYDLKHNQLLPHTKGLLLTRGIDLEYEVDTECPLWDDFLLTILPSPDLISYIQKAVGYSLTGDCSEQCLFFCYGSSGNNGKSTFIETMLYLFGDYAKQTTTDTLMAKFGDPGISNDVARLKDARFVAAPETEDGKRLAESTVKRLTGGDTITARFMHQEFFEFKPQFKIWMTGNHRPEIRGTDDAIWRRVKLIPFQVTVPIEDRDPNLKEKLSEELPGILAWAIRGHQAWREGRLGEPEAVRVAVGEYRAAMDKIGAFLDDRTINGSERVSVERLYDAYSEWCKASGEYAITKRKLGDAMKERGRGAERVGGGMWYLGIDLKVLGSNAAIYRGDQDYQEDQD